MTQTPIRVSPEWLALREPADAAARSTELADEVARMLPATGRRTIHDLACGTGSMARWLAPRLTGPQHWILYDWDPDLLTYAAGGMPNVAADGSPITFETRSRDITRLDLADLADLAGAALITASALLDMLTSDEVDRLVAACLGAGCPALLTLSVVGRVVITPEDSLDQSVQEGFNDHQRRTAGGRRLLGPDAVVFAAEDFTRRGADVLLRPSPWRLGPTEATLAAEWFVGWLGAACDQRPELNAATTEYGQRRSADAAAGRLGIAVSHHDLLVRAR
jgi:SAM-dependent methyltransferase